jgi:hypothetical protein
MHHVPQAMAACPSCSISLVSELATVWCPDQFAWINPQSLGNLAQDGNTCRNLSALYRTEVADAQSSTISQLLLRQFSCMASAPHIYGHGLLEVHGHMGKHGRNDVSRNDRAESS